GLTPIKSKLRLSQFNWCQTRQTPNFLCELQERSNFKMPMVDMMLMELDQEAATTRRLLERVPGDKLGWKPHAKSMTLGELAMHVATTPAVISQFASVANFELPDHFEQPIPASAEEV